jgi:hypothetical protein
MSFLLNLQTSPQGPESGAGTRINVFSTLSVGQICLLSTISLNFC